VTPTLAGNKNRPLEILLGQWVKTLPGRNDIFSESLVKGSKKFCVSNSMKGTQGDFICYKNHEENPSSSDKSGGSDYLATCL
jgi:hypothetical protein